MLIIMINQRPRGTNIMAVLQRATSHKFLCQTPRLTKTPADKVKCIHNAALPCGITNSRQQLARCGVTEVTGIILSPQTTHTVCVGTVCKLKTTTIVKTVITHHTSLSNSMYVVWSSEGRRDVGDPVVKLVMSLGIFVVFGHCTLVTAGWTMLFLPLQRQIFLREKKNNKLVAHCLPRTEENEVSFVCWWRFITKLLMQELGTCSHHLLTVLRFNFSLLAPWSTSEVSVPEPLFTCHCAL